MQQGRSDTCAMRSVCDEDRGDASRSITEFESERAAHLQNAARASHRAFTQMRAHTPKELDEKAIFTTVVVSTMIGAVSSAGAAHDLPLQVGHLGHRPPSLRCAFLTLQACGSGKQVFSPEDTWAVQRMRRAAGSRS